MYVIDNTVLSNFAVIGKIKLLHEILRCDAFTTKEVEVEFRYKPSFRKVKIKFGVVDISAKDLEDFERILQITGPRGLHSGEISCILSVIDGKADVILTDDLLARKYCKKEGIEAHGTVFVLAIAVKEKILTIDQAESTLNEMKEKGYSLKKKITVQMAFDGLD